MQLSNNLKLLFPALSTSTRKSGSEADILSNALYLYLLSLPDGDMKKEIEMGINFSIIELDKLLSSEEIIYASHIDLNRNYIVKAGHPITEVVSDEKIEEHIDEIRIHLEKMKNLKNTSVEEDAPAQKISLEEFDLSLETTTCLEPSDNAEDKEEDSLETHSEVGDEAKLEDILDQSPEESDDDKSSKDSDDDDDDVHSIFDSSEYDEEEEGSFSHDEDYYEEEEVIDLHGGQEPYINESDIGDDGDINDFGMEKLVLNKKPHPDDKEVSKKIKKYMEDQERY